ncbi:MAG: hypothetical protein ACW97X_08720 [Candidatus Hodarchaeales archaeon]|jgi:hypothetical protein
MSGDFGESLALLANLEFDKCKECGKNVEKTKLQKGLCSECLNKDTKVRKISTPVKRNITNKRKHKKTTTTTSRKELENRITRQQSLIEKLTSENIELLSQVNHLLDRMENLEERLSTRMDREQNITLTDPSTEISVDYDVDQEKIVISFYDFVSKRFHFFTSEEIEDQLLVKMILKIESNLNSAGQLKVVQIIGEDYLNKKESTPIKEVQDFIRFNAQSFNRTFLPLANHKIKKFGKKQIHCEIIEKTFDEDLNPAYIVTDLGKRYFALWKQYFSKKNVIERIKSATYSTSVKGRWLRLYNIVHSHFTLKRIPVTRQELFTYYKLKKYDIDTFKIKLTEIGLIQKVPISKEKRYQQDLQLPRYEVAYRPRYPEINPDEIKAILNGI